MSTAVHNPPSEATTAWPSVTAPVASVLRLGAAVSVIQSVLFVTIGVSALLLGVDTLVNRGFAALTSADPTAFRVLCGAFVLIAVLGIAITPAERLLVDVPRAGLAGFGAALAYLGHAGTIAFFSWWLLKSVHDAPVAGLGPLAPIDWGVMFELVFVGAWVWVIAALLRGTRFSPPGPTALRSHISRAPRDLERSASRSFPAQAPPAPAGSRRSAATTRAVTARLPSGQRTQAARTPRHRPPPPPGRPGAVGRAPERMALEDQPFTEGADRSFPGVPLS